MKVNELNEIGMPAFTARQKAMKKGKQEVADKVKLMTKHIYMMMGKTNTKELTYGKLGAFLKNTPHYAKFLKDPDVAGVVANEFSGNAASSGDGDATDPAFKSSRGAGKFKSSRGAPKFKSSRNQPEQPQFKSRRNNIVDKNFDKSQKLSAYGKVGNESIVHEAVDPNTPVDKKQLQKIATMLVQKSFEDPDGPNGLAGGTKKSGSKKIPKSVSKEPMDDPNVQKAVKILRKAGITGVRILPGD